MSGHTCVHMCVFVCERACVRACFRACVGMRKDCCGWGMNIALLAVCATCLAHNLSINMQDCACILFFILFDATKLCLRGDNTELIN